MALRRLRSAFSLFKHVVADERSDHLRGELRWLSGVLGEARNLDVLIPKIADPALLGRLQTAREKAYGDASVATRSARARGLMLDLAEWLTLGSWLAPLVKNGRNQTVEKFATAILERFRRRVKQLGFKLADVDDERRHELRIEAKKLRYATEFFASLFDEKKLRRKRERFRRTLETLQEQLGSLNDMATAPLVLKMLGEPVNETAEPDVAKQADLLLAAEASHAALLKTGRFWSRRSGS